MWTFFREIGFEIATELAKKYGPAGIVTDVIDAVGALGQGDVLDFMGEVFDIVRRKVPALAAVSMTLDGIELGGKAGKVWRAIAKMEDFGSDVIGKLLTVVQNRAGSLLGEFKWKNNSIGAELFDVGDPLDFWGDLVNLFPNKVPITGGLPGEIIYKMPPSDWTLKFYIDANTQGRTTIEFKSGSYRFKLRF